MSEKRAKQIRRASKRTASAPVGIVHIRAGYDAATSSINRSTVSHAVQDAVKDLTPSVLKALRRNSRYLDCNSAVYSGAVKRMTTLIVGTGIMATSASKDAEWGNAATARYSEWGKSCDITGTSDMPALLNHFVSVAMPPNVPLWNAPWTAPSATTSRTPCSKRPI